MRQLLFKKEVKHMSDKFRLMIDSAAKSKQEIQNEIQRLIRAKIERVVDEAKQNAEEQGEKIPPRESIYYGRKPQQKDISLPDTLAYAPESPDNSSEIYDKIQEMRALGQTFHNGYMLRQCAELTIVKQGEFMKDVTDDFGRSAFCAIDRPIYGALSAEQLRTYFTWRTDARKGTYYKIDRPYVILYCYELLNKIGVLSSDDAFNRLIGVWENCREFCPSLDQHMTRWMRDFYAFNHIAEDFSQLSASFPVDEKNTDETIAQLFACNYHGKLEYLMSCSSYNLKGSIFFSEETALLIDECCEQVLSAMNSYFLERGLSLFELICGRQKKDFGWSPFAGAYVDLDRMDGFHQCHISATERYCIKRGQPCLERFEYAPYRGFIGYILKAVESVLRERTGFRYSIVPNLSMVLDNFFNREKIYKAASEAEFSALIPETVNRYCDEHGIFPPRKENKRRKSCGYEDKTSEPSSYLPPKKIEIDISALEDIRRAAEETTKKLIIEEYEDALPEEKITAIADTITDEVFEELTTQAKRENNTQLDFSTINEPWKSFAEALDTQLIQLLIAIDHGNSEAFCHELGVLPETIFEELNALSLEHIGDVIIENSEYVPDYYEDIKNIISAAT